MDEIFKFAIDVIAYEKARHFMTSWQGQVVLIDQYWNRLLDSIDLTELTEMFNRYCEPEDLPSADYNLLEALARAKNEWRVEMMTAAANNIAFDFASYDVPYKTELVKWNDNLRVMEFVDYALF